MKIISILFFLLFFSGEAFAQEVQVPFDSSGSIQIVNQDLEQRLDLFPTYPHFLEARLYHEPDSSYILEITSFENGQMVKDRIPKSANAVRLLREDVDARLGPQAPVVKLDQSSRTKFLVWETILSLSGYAPAIESGFSSNNVGLNTGIELVIGGLGYLIPSVLTQNAPMTDGEGSLALGGAFLGAAHGLLIDVLLSNGNTGLEIGPFAAAVSVGETGIGYAIASKNNMSEGTADIIRYGGLFGMMDGLGLAFVANNTPSPSLWAGLSLAGSAAGYAAGTVMANNQTYTRGDASVVLTAGLFGTLLPPLLYASAISYNTATNPASALVLLAVAGNVGGVVLGNSLMQGKQFSNGEGTAVILGTTAGYTIGLGIGDILTSSNQINFSPWEFTVPIVIGTAAGFGISVATIGKGTGENSSTGWNFQANPGALMGALLPQRQPNTPFIPPFFSAHCDF
ncbi:MAG TPA: hypothetical protein VFD13_02790 [Candidatus Kapabacteria bacterium]|nr:hypothetical protein [Candidatus Kapabacteria bacterium]